MELKDKLNKIFNSSGSFVIQNVLKRSDGDWYNRIVWVHYGQPGNRLIRTCDDWFGFDNVDDCVDDCLKYIKTEFNES